AAQYRNRHWSDSLASIEKLKAMEGGPGAQGWLISAMALYRLKRPEEARAALRKAVEWMDEQKRQAEASPALRQQYEEVRPTLEALRQEAESLLKGNDPNDAVG